MVTTSHDSSSCERKAVDTPLLGRTGRSKASYARWISAITALAAVGVIAVVVNSNFGHQVSLLQKGAVKYYYVPTAAIKSNNLPLHLMVPQGKGKPVEYTLVASPLTSLDGNATAAAPAAGANGTDAAKPAAPAFSCTVANIKKEAAAVYGAWDKCASSSDYKAPNANAKRRLLSVDPAKTQSLKWVWVPASKDEKMSAAPATQPESWAWQMLEGNATAPAAGAANATTGGNTLSACEAAAVGKLCVNLASCENPVCASYYTDEDVERICGICTMSAAGAGFGCFAADSEIVVEGKGSMRMDQIKVGDRVEASGADGERIFSRVYFIHDHADESPLLHLAHSAGILKLTSAHSVPVYTASCGEKYCDAARLVTADKIRVGDRIYVATPEGYLAKAVEGVSSGSGLVRYALTESGNLVVGGAVASVLSTAAGALETLPFRLIDWAAPGALQSAPVAAALYTILESPALRTFEALVDRVANAGVLGKPAAALPAWRALSAASVSH